MVIRTDPVVRGPMSPRPRIQPAVRGLTLLELIAVMVIVLVIAGVAAPAMQHFGQARAAVAARHVEADFAFARQFAAASGRTCWVVFLPEVDRWMLLADDRDLPGLEHAQPVADAATGRAYVVQLGEAPFASVELLSADFDGEPAVGFDWRGRPQNSTGEPLAETGVVVLSSGHQVKVEPGSGHPRIDEE